MLRYRFAWKTFGAHHHGLLPWPMGSSVDCGKNIRCRAQLRLGVEDHGDRGRGWSRGHLRSVGSIPQEANSNKAAPSVLTRWSALQPAYGAGEGRGLNVCRKV